MMHTFSKPSADKPRESTASEIALYESQQYDVDMDAGTALVLPGSGSSSTTAAEYAHLSRMPNGYQEFINTNI